MKRIVKAIILIVLSVVCFVCFFGCNSQKSNNFIELSNWFHTSCVLNNVIVVNYQDEEVICKFSCERGRLGAIGYAKAVREVEAKVNQEVSWVSVPENPLETVYHDHITILLLKNNDVVGYAVLEVSIKEDMYNHQAKILHQELLKVTLSEHEAKQLVSKIINEKGCDY